ncbi:asparagine synthetase B family protein [Tahibacter amnicola]|uniref:asparagine synthase (glutamine-hydrolyzing) n=1 Tax=Tahibacter amnicola TaxID=2976241 RepID=A0ABY6B8D0_9GAMM|nr:asparagine synthase C-terminal domain-containing protein [Tahibacter amnicola]UXI66336.1 asparagine synthase C-terminal domain-containing protein [Tahibacter amnicola]
METTRALREILSRRTAPAASVGQFVTGLTPDSPLFELAPELGAALCAVPLRRSGAALVLESSQRVVVGVFDLAVGTPEELLTDAPAPWEGWRGRFCFVRVDLRSGEWIAVTDHFGTLPLYYTEYEDQFLIGNRLAPLLRAPWCQRRADASAIFHYLNFACIPAPLTVVPEVKRLPPGSLWRRGSQAGRVETWWQPRYAEDLDGTPAALAGQLRERIVATVQRYRPGSDTNWGAFLSGGTDSSSVVSILAQQAPRDTVHSYSIGFAEPGYDELGFARIAAGACGARGHFGSVDEVETLSVLPRLTELFDQPFGNASAVPTLACAGMAAEDGRNVLLAGDGGDEIFGGNERYAKDQIMHAFYRLPRPIKALGRWIGRGLGGGRVRLFNRIDNFARRASLPNPDRFYMDDAFASEHFDHFLSPALRTSLTPSLSLAFMRELYAGCDARAELHRLMALDLNMAIAQNDLVKVDGACRHVGVGARFPFLDPDLVNYTGRLKAHWKVRRLDKRHLFKQAMEPILPPAILRKPKQGFGLPISVWIAERPAFREWMRDLLLSQRSRERGWFEPDFVQRLFDRHVAGEWDFSASLWQLAVLELWMRQHLDG